MASLAVVLATGCTVASTNREAAPVLPLETLHLYETGVGYFERQDRVSGDTTIDLQFKASEMNDVLKSLTAIDWGGGQVLNVIAIAAGICDGIELGDNAKAALVTRGLAEMVRLGVRLGGGVQNVDHFGAECAVDDHAGLVPRGERGDDVVVGAARAGRVEILSGLEEGDEVVLDGYFQEHPEPGNYEGAPAGLERMMAYLDQGLLQPRLQRLFLCVLHCGDACGH